MKKFIASGIFLFLLCSYDVLFHVKKMWEKIYVISKVCRGKTGIFLSYVKYFVIIHLPYLHMRYQWRNAKRNVHLWFHEKLRFEFPWFWYTGILFQENRQVEFLDKTVIDFYLASIFFICIIALKMAQIAASYSLHLKIVFYFDYRPAMNAKYNLLFWNICIVDYFKHWGQLVRDLSIHTFYSWWMLTNM